MFLIRSDSSYAIGTGHLMRNLALAEGLRACGETVEFISAPLAGSQHLLVREKGFPLHLLSGPELSQGADARECRRFLSSTERPRRIVVDHYGLRAEWESFFVTNSTVIAIDDLANRPHRAQVLIDSNYRSNYRDMYKDLVPKDCLVLLGPKYSFLRTDITAARHSPFATNEEVLVFFGGADLSNETQKFIDALNECQPAASFTIVVGAAHPQRKDLERRSLPTKSRLLVQPADFSRRLRQAALYFGSGGTITWERMYLGLPGVVVAVAANQEASAQDLARDGYQKYLGRREGVNYRDAIALCCNLLQDTTWRTQTSRRTQQLVQPIDVIQWLKLLEGVDAV